MPLPVTGSASPPLPNVPPQSQAYREDERRLQAGVTVIHLPYGMSFSRMRVMAETRSSSVASPSSREPPFRKGAILA